MKKFHVGIQLYGVRNAMEKDFEGTLKALADMGYEYVEFAGYYGHTAEEIKAILDKYGLKCLSAHQALDFYDEDPDAAAEFLKAFGVKYSVIPWYGKEKLEQFDIGDFRRFGCKDWEKHFEPYFYTRLFKVNDQSTGSPAWWLACTPKNKRNRQCGV